MSLPPALVESVRNGNAVLFLGSGALIGASLGSGDIPLGNDLRDLLSDKFLEGAFKGETLHYVSDLAISAHSLSTVQGFIGDYFTDLILADFHKKIPSFLWKCIFTTNYDRLVEIAYENNPDRMQKLNKIYSNEDVLEESARTNDIVPLLKLHGCITVTTSEEFPLILTVDQYNESLKGNRKGLFNYLYEIAGSNPIIFIGHSLQDANIRAVLMDVHKQAPHGQRHYLLKPGVADIERDLWAQQKITTVGYTFEQFLTELDSAIDPSTRQLALVIPPQTHQVESRFITQSKASPELIRFLTESCEYVSRSSTFESFSPDLFYKGADLGWYPIEEQLTIERGVSARIKSIVVDVAEPDRESKAEIHVIKGEAGSGKSIILRQLAWVLKDAGIGIFLWMNSESSADINAIAELFQKTGERIFLIWDNAARNAIQIANFYKLARQNDINISIVTAERYNEWNNKCRDLDSKVTNVFELHYLNENEVGQLVTKLEEHDCLGPNLISKSHGERIETFRTMYGRQLLVALYEATKGESFEDIIFDEYTSIAPATAQQIYRTICTLNRIRVPVRAGLISRIHGVSFKDFESNFLSPLEKIVIIGGKNSFDYHYSARHPEIAEIVFNRALSDPTECYNEYIRILRKINTSFSSDKNSLRTLIKAKNLMDLFPSHEDIRHIFETVEESTGDDHYLFQQMAIYERRRADGNLTNAGILLEKAIEMAPYDRSLIHSLAQNWSERSRRSEDPATKIKFRAESRAQLEKAISKWGDNSYNATLVANLLLDDLRDVLNIEASSQRLIDEQIRKVERCLIELGRKFPSENHTYIIEANFAELLNDNDRVRQALESSFKDNNRDPYIASRLSSIYQSQGNFEKAENVLTQAIERRPSDQKLNFRYAEHLRKQGNEAHITIAYYYKRAYTPGDKSYQAQFWHGRFLYESEDNAEKKRAITIFSNLRNAGISHTEKKRIQDYVGGIESPKPFSGELIGKKPGFGFIKVDGGGAELFFPYLEVVDDIWEALQVGDRLTFNIGFSFSGVVACNVRPL